MKSSRRKLLEHPARYQCIVCGGRLMEFHLCECCLQPVHPGCICHPSSEQKDTGTDSYIVLCSGLSFDEEHETKIVRPSIAA